MQATAAIHQRPFSVEPLTGIMLPDGIFDTALIKQVLNVYVRNDGPDAMDDVQVYLESIGDGGIQVTAQTHAAGRLAAGETCHCSWSCDFSNASPGKPYVSICVRASGYEKRRVLKQIFVSRTRYDRQTDRYTCEVPEGTLEMRVAETSGPPRIFKHGEPVPQPGPWILRRFTLVSTASYTGQYGPLPFGDPWWKVLAWIIAAIAGIIAVIAAILGNGTASAQMTCEFDARTGAYSNCTASANNAFDLTPAGIASTIAAGAVRVGLADEIDPFRRGQEQTPVQPGERTLSEEVVVELLPTEDFSAGGSNRTDVNWYYTRTTDRGVHRAGAQETREDVHRVGAVRVEAPVAVQIGVDRFLVHARVARLDGTPFVGDELYLVALVVGPDGDEFRLVLADRGRSGGFGGTFDLVRARGQLVERSRRYLGVWSIYLYAQDVNQTTEGTPPQIAAQTLGGCVLVAPVTVTLRNESCPISVAHALVEVSI